MDAKSRRKSSTKSVSEEKLKQTSTKKTEEKPYSDPVRDKRDSNGLYGSFTTLTEEDISIKRVKIGRYLRGVLLGAGSFGSVYEAFDTDSRKVVALKVFNHKVVQKKQSIESFNASSNSINQVETEIKMLSKLPPNNFIVEYLESFESTNEKLSCLATSLVKGETLQSLIESKGPLPYNQCKHVFWSLTEALSHLKQNGVIHGDVKPENILISKDHAVRLGDFGCAAFVQDIERSTFKELAARSPMFQSPEIANDIEIRNDNEWFLLEVWALGINLYYMCIGRYPFQMDLSYLDLLDCISNFSFEKKHIANEEICDLICKVLTKLELRLTLEQIKKHPFIADYFGEMVADRSDWKIASVAELTFVNGVDPRLYERSLQDEIPEEKEEDIVENDSTPSPSRDETDTTQARAGCCVIL